MESIFNIASATEAFTHPNDPGFIYLMKDRGRYKIGKTTSPESRVQSARTWIPDIEIIGIKPFWFHSELEHYIHIGLAMFSYRGEWFDFENDPFEEDFIIDFKHFSDKNPISNTRSFTYFVNGNGMSSYTMEWSRQDISKRQFFKEHSFHTTNILKNEF